MAGRQFTGIQKIGALLGGGAGIMKSQAYEEGRLTTAKTEEALAQARKSQLEATAAAAKQRAAENFERNYIDLHPDDPDAGKTASFMGDLIRSGGGSDYSATTTGLGNEQTMGFRDTLADTGATPQAHLQAGSAIKGEQLPRYKAAGSQGVEDLLNPTGPLIKGPGTGTTAMRNYEFGESLPPDKRDDFSPYVRADQIVNAGNVPTARRATTGSATPVVPAEQVATNASIVSEAKDTGKKRAAQKADFPAVRMTLDQNKLNIKETNSIAMEVLGNEKLWQAVGPTQLISEIPGTEGRYLRSQIDVLKNKVMLQTLINLRSMSKTGGAVGNVSDAEGHRMENAIAALSDPNISAGDFRKELARLIAYNEEFQGNMQNAFDATYDKDGNPLLSIAPRGTPDAADGGEGSIEDVIIQNGDGEYDGDGNLVRADGSGWTFMRDAQGNAAWVSPDGSQIEEVAQ